MFIWAFNSIVLIKEPARARLNFTHVFYYINFLRHCFVMSEDVIWFLYCVNNISNKLIFMNELFGLFFSNKWSVFFEFSSNLKGDLTRWDTLPAFCFFITSITFYSFFLSFVQYIWASTRCEMVLKRVPSKYYAKREYRNYAAIKTYLKITFLKLNKFPLLIF